mgnify:FL=1
MISLPSQIIDLETRVTFRENFDCKLFNFYYPWEYIIWETRNINEYKPTCDKCNSVDLFLGRCMTCGNIIK